MLIFHHINFSKFSDVLPAFIGASALVDFWNICLSVNSLIREAKFKAHSFPWIAFYLPSDVIEEKSLNNLRAAYHA